MTAARVLAAACLAVAVPGAPPHAPLTVEWIMRGPGLYGWPPKDVRWSGDSKQVFFQWKRWDEPLAAEYSTWVVNADGSGLRKLTDEQEKEAPPVGGADTRDWRITVTADDGDIFLYDRMAGRRHRLTKTADVESAPRFTHDEKRITFLRGGNLFVLSPADGSLEQLTDIRPEGSKVEGEEKKGTESQEFLKKEQRSLLDIVKERAGKREEAEGKRKKENPRKPLVLGKRQTVRELWLSPDERFVLAMIAEAPEDAKTTVVPNFVTESGYTEDISSREKVGDRRRSSKVAFVDVQTGAVKWLNHELDKRAPEFFSPRWSDDGSKLILTGRAADNKDEWIFAVDPETATLRVLVNKRDEAWVGGPAREDAGWIPASSTVYFTWERTGWSHLYSIPFEGGEAKALTGGKWEVRDVALSPDRRRFHITTSEAHSGENQLYELAFDGGPRKRLTAMTGGHEAVMSPDGRVLATIYSYVNQPPELYLQPVGAAKGIRVTDSPAPEFHTYQWLDVPLVEIPLRDGQKAPAHMYKPKNWSPGGPMVVFVHGAGYLQNVHRRWSQYSREYLFHHLLMERGYMVLDVDYRASAGYGRDWRTAIYEHMGGKDLDDQVDAVKWAIATHGVNPNRVGIYGGSYGGFITLMAMFTQPDVFRAGAALRPVTDWAHYNHGYTSNILNTPQADEAAYRRSSPIYHAEGLKGALLICHGMVDTNVHFQDTVRLTQRLIELGKQNWELAVYPAEDHGFTYPSSWTDEYRRILKLFEGL